AVGLVSGAETDAVESVEHIELGNREIGQTVDARGVAHDHAVEPAAPTRTSRRGAELVAQLSHLCCERLIELGWKRAVSDTRRVGFYDTNHRIELAWRDANTGRGATGRRAA